jgi:hypothetical protein
VWPFEQQGARSSRTVSERLAVPISFRIGLDIRALWLRALLSVACSVSPDQAVIPNVAASDGGDGGFRDASTNTDVGAGGSAGATQTIGQPDSGHEAGGGGSAIAAGGAGGSTTASGGATQSGGASAASGGTTQSDDADAASRGDARIDASAAGGSDTQDGAAPMDGGDALSDSSTVDQDSSDCCAPPHVLVLPATADTYLSGLSSEQTNNFGDNSQLLVSGITDARARALVNFDLSSIGTGEAIVHATLRLVLADNVAAAHSLSAYRVITSWAENRANWIRGEPSSKWTTPGGDTAAAASGTATLPAGAGAGTQVDFDVKADLEAMIAGTAPSSGWLVDTAPSEPTVSFISRDALVADQRPVLLVEVYP